MPILLSVLLFQSLPVDSVYLTLPGRAILHMKSLMLTAGPITLHVFHHKPSEYCKEALNTFEPPRGKTNNMVSEQARHKPACTVTEAGYKLEILELSRGGIVLSE